MILIHDPTQDRAIRNEAADKLDRGPFVESLVRALVRQELDNDGKLKAMRAHGHVVGLTGRWGLGKSSIVNLLALKLGAMDRVLVAQFNPWLVGSRDELLTGFFNALRSATGRNTREEMDALRNDIDKYWGAINFAGHAVAAGASISGFGFLKKAREWIKPNPRTPDEERVSLEKKLEKLGCAVVVLIDELDRVEDDEVRAVARLIKAVGEIKGLSYLVAYDPERVVEALGRGTPGERRENGARYLEKIVQHQIPLRPLFDDDTRPLLEAALEQQGLALPDDPEASERIIFDHLVAVIETPREVKRLVGSFAVLEPAVRGEISPYDVLGYCWLIAKAPTLRDRIAEQIDALVDDPGEDEMLARLSRQMDKESSPDIVAVLGDGAAPYRTLLHLLFPRFSSQPTAGGGRRLSRRRNLVRMLYLGNPPGMIHRGQVERLWTGSDLKALEAELRSARGDNVLSGYLDRLDDLLPELPEAHDVSFWTGLARSLVRESDWIKGPDDASARAEEAATALMRLGLRDNRQKPRVRKVLSALIADGDLVVAPWILRKTLLANGLSPNSKGPKTEAILDLAQSKKLLDSELARYRQAVLSGYALKRIPRVELYFILSQSGAWDEALRRSLTRQLSSAKAIGTLASLFVPPGYIIERETVDEFCDSHELRTRTERLLKRKNSLPDPWVNQCVRRLAHILAGRDAIFADEV
ncbi:P-loop NTPase fold protein [Sphingopyxis sp. 22461]|uniref:P-loop NTPase fold protein n=1 Tax=Sphingopyxis sp. 22461 TaxID=3453923 RepID=UPI003F83E8D8